ncbi:unnamed protein product [Eruca vesicaria subsp. sativa]|uniref:Ubiquitin-like-conjugating enzyme ATG10 n=1 Tax=Eruca vesicaria subsp. sativa TaxID=29727 RepID=A0ABC8IY18_ERUVS|nr:unnamed protein product [Eruca vesicaria subsp. sativa]
MDSAGEVVNDGKITLEGFSVAARSFAEKWKRLNLSFPPWSWVPLNNRTLLKKEEGYLSLEKIIILSSLDESVEEESLDVRADWSEKEEAVDHTVLVQDVEDEAHYYDYHIVYSASYMVPMLYFRGYSSDGKPLSLEVIKRDLPSSSVSLLLESKWTFITQEDHPYLNRPWFKLHPCGTEEWIKLLSESSSFTGCQMPVELYLISWFSVVGQVVGLKIPHEMLI